MFSNREIFEREAFRCPPLRIWGSHPRDWRGWTAVPKPKKLFKFSQAQCHANREILPIIVNPGLPKIRVDRPFDLFFALCQFPGELLHVSVVEGWKECCRVSVCWLDEIWIQDLRLFKSIFKVLSQFDYVLISCSQSVVAVQNLFGGSCAYIPPAVDSIFFCPFPEPPERSIDVLSIGRRPEGVHQALLRMAKEKKIFYVYDSFKDMHVHDLENTGSYFQAWQREADIS